MKKTTVGVARSRNKMFDELEALPFYRGHREGWCKAILREFQVALPNIHPEMVLPEERSIRVSIAPIQRGNALGLCYPSSHSPDNNVNHIVVSPLRENEWKLAKTLLHELLHAIDDCNSRHQGRWKRMADRVGMHARGDELNAEGQKLVWDALHVVGRLKSHENQVMVKRKKEPALVAYTCPVCDQKAYVSNRLHKEGVIDLHCGFDGEKLLHTP